MRMATMRVKPITTAAVMATNLFLGMGSCTCSSRRELELVLADRDINLPPQKEKPARKTRDHMIMPHTPYD